ncbi:RluA family pseudouridine synthase [Asticcacaulis sp. YBE204]|uniref:RluA family pseudouridine synthase n=1 Tax=Asticcacaulis sp. YBE204 TaxID=1282363 RepID=UPI0003C3C73D|nr:pseudouridine synthase [Asticcacaulis sp. YBE204]ESQ76952.1 pseudouridine synthase [Asticcacaulis sp. YBE204]
MIPLYEDDALLVFDKPAGLLSVPGRLPENKDSLAPRVQAIWPDALIVHRLDMATSGLIVMARGAEAHRTLSIAFAERRVHKRYVAVVAGQVRDEEGEVDLPLITDWPNRPKQMIDYTIGKPSLTRYRVIAREADRTRVELEPVTGRSHQLRVHMMALGHPIIGDVFYAPTEIQALSSRLWLHAERLDLPHPVTGEALRFEAPAAF